MLLRSLSDCLARPEVITPCSTPKDEEGEEDETMANEAKDKDSSDFGRDGYSDLLLHVEYVTVSPRAELKRYD